VSYFIAAIEHERKMHARFQDLILHKILEIITSSFSFLEFSTEHQCTNTILVKSTMLSGSRGFMQNLRCIFLMFTQLSMNFGTLYEFLELNKQKQELENNLPATGPNLAKAQHGRPSLAAKTAHGWPIPGWACSPCRNRGGRLSWHRGGDASGRTRAVGEVDFGVGRRARRWCRSEGGSPTGEAVRARPGCMSGEASARMENLAAAADSGAESGDGSRGGGTSESR
jgi:hypothetical protein